MMADIIDKNGRLIVSGELDFETVPAVWKRSLVFLANYAAIDIDLSNVTTANSAGLALLLEWLKYSKHKNKVIHFAGIPPQLESIAKVAGFDFSRSSSSIY